jgi:hypothetical protein
MRTVFLRALDAGDKASALRSAIQKSLPVDECPRFEVDPSSFREVPRSPFAYWAGASLLGQFAKNQPFGASDRITRQGLATADDFRFLRLWWEPAPGSNRRRWFPIAKGGAFSRHYGDFELSLNWTVGQEHGRELKAFAESTPNTTHWSRRIPCSDLYFREGLTWPLRSQRGLSLRPMPRGVVFGQKGSAAFVPGDLPQALLSMDAVFSSQAGLALVAMQMAFGAYDVGVIARTPVPDLTPADEAALASLARRAWSLKRSLDTRTEASHAFVLPALLQTGGHTLAARSVAWTEHVHTVEVELAEIQAEIDERCFELYGIDDDDRRAITEGFGASSADAESSEAGADTDTEDEVETEAAADTTTLAAALVSWAVGVAFGRFDVRLAIGARELPAEPEPFDPLPVCSSAMLTGDDGLPLARPPAGYPIAFPEDGILIDDPGHPRDLMTAVRAVFETVFGTSADAVWQEAAALLDPKSHDLRTWLAIGFFGHHLTRHSKSRRKAPILWQLGTPSARYSTWLYAHRLTRDSLFALARDVVAPKLALEERRQASLVQDAGANPIAKQRVEIDAQAAVVAELRVFADEVRRIAPLWKPDLDDGIVLVMAPLWRLVPHKPWQKELKSRWDDLATGKYDWAHLSMHLWPERVVPKCANDRSLAIAHGLEDVFWVEGVDGKWTRRARPTRLIEDLVAERTSPAVKAALADLLGAPGPAAGGRGRGRSS